MNKLFNNNITLDRDSHTYKLASNPDLEFVSVTTFISHFFKPFDSEKIATRLAGSLKYRQMTKEDILQSWRDAADHGTKVHEELENYILNNKEITEPKAEQGIKWLNKFRLKSNFEIFSEVIIYSEELKISGTIDLLLYDKNCNKYIIMDWKTSKNIRTKSFNNEKGISPATSNIDDSKFNHYALQLSLYRYLLETDYNLDISEHIIIHLKENACLGLHAPYMKNSIIKMLQTTGK